MANQTTSFGIAQYILLFLVAALCVGIVAWTMITAAHKDNITASTPTITHITNTDPCVQNITNTVSQIWAYNPELVPQIYMDMATNYANEQITTKIYGACNDIKFVCRPGQIRRDCDPCAIGGGRQMAMDQQIADMVQENCPETQK